MNIDELRKSEAPAYEHQFIPAYPSLEINRNTSCVENIKNSRQAASICFVSYISPLPGIHRKNGINIPEHSDASIQSYRRNICNVPHSDATPVVPGFQGKMAPIARGLEIDANYQEKFHALPPGVNVSDPLQACSSCLLLPFLAAQLSHLSPLLCEAFDNTLQTSYEGKAESWTDPAANATRTKDSLNCQWNAEIPGAIRADSSGPFVRTTARRKPGLMNAETLDT
ncbi:hypothetical protein BXZ70DRAFT_904911 [Cristinia sonorae]|uniref:Uncharacterized protein n=1 Tax=Cristinia sonorae TaxID=1940300 RepID=A0A8K0UVT2_9AGAR|nr:hypothetical protein BXZ70DRAFT_904911 [Cristinia sonorae]